MPYRLSYGISNRLQLLPDIVFRILDAARAILTFI